MRAQALFLRSSGKSHRGLQDLVEILVNAVRLVEGVAVRDDNRNLARGAGGEELLGLVL
jgi:hypothetical protein